MSNQTPERWMLIHPSTVIAYMLIATLCAAFLLQILGYGEVPKELIAVAGPIIGFFFKGQLDQMAWERAS